MPLSAPDAATACLRILTLLCNSRSALSLDDVMHETGLSARQVHNAYRALETEGYAISEGPHGLFAIGPKFLYLAKQARSNQFLEQEVRPVLRELAQLTGETVTFNSYTPGQNHIICVLVEESPAPLHYAVEVGEVKPLHAGSSGRAILAHLEDADVDAYIARTGLPAVTARTITNPEKLKRELGRIRKRGYAMSRGQRVDGAIAVAGSVFDADGRIYACIVLTTPTYRFEAAKKDHTIDCVIDAARRISSLIVQVDGR